MVDAGVMLSWGTLYTQFLDEAAALIVRHWNEVGQHRDILRLDPDHDRYLALERAGALHILVARDATNRIVGYAFVIGPVPHPRDRAAMMGTDDIIYAEPMHRRRGVGIQMMIESDRKLDELGCHIILRHEKYWRRALPGGRGGYPQHFGYTPAEIVHTKVLRAPHPSEAAS